jgi:uncharacterized protein (DUF305 family)
MAMPTHSRPHAAHSREHGAGGHAHNPYVRLLAMTVLSFVAMYVLMYAMVDSVDNILNNVNQAYMAGLMAASMVIIELGVMRAVRGQGGVGDRQFLRSMIPHHASAILMCTQAGIRDREIEQLCRTIIASQSDEIRQMRAKLQELER